MSGEISRRSVVKAGGIAVLATSPAPPRRLCRVRGRKAPTPRRFAWKWAPARCSRKFRRRRNAARHSTGSRLRAQRRSQHSVEEADLRERMANSKAGGITLYNLMIGGFPKTIYGQPGRDEEIERVRQSIRAAGKAGLPVVEYNFYAHRAMEGYYESARPRRLRLHRLSITTDEGPAAARARKARTVWMRCGPTSRYFLKAVIPGGAGIRRADGAASQRSTGAAEPRVGSKSWVRSPGGRN